MKKLLGFLVVVVGLSFMVPKAIPIAKGVLDNLFKGGAVSQAVVERAWEQQTVGNLSFDAPWDLWTKNIDLPAAVQDSVMSSEARARENDGLMIMAMRTTYIDGVTVSLSGAAEGAEKSIRAAPGAKDVQFSYDNTSVAMLPAMEVNALVTRTKGEPLRFRGLVVVRGTSLYQVLLSYRADQPAGEVAWRKLRGSAMIDGKT